MTSRFAISVHVLCYGLVFLVTTVNYTVISEELPFTITSVNFDSPATTSEGTRSLHLYCSISFEEELAPFYGSVEPILEHIGISFHKDNIPFTRNRDITGEAFVNRTGNRFIRFRNDNTIETSIGINPVLRTDSGGYGCLVFDNNDIRLTELRQRFVYVNFYPRCTPAIQRIYLGGQTTLRCVSEVGNPPVSLRWRSENEALNKSIIQSQETVIVQDGFITSDLQLVTTSTDISDEYTCEIYSPTFFLQLRTCFISLRMTWPHPVVTLDPIQAHVNSSGGYVEFSCRIHSGLASLNTSETWDWYTEPPLDQSKVLSDGSGLQIGNVETSDNGTVIFCLALFDGQWFQSTGGILYVDEEQPTTQTILSSTTDYYTEPSDDVYNRLESRLRVDPDSVHN